MAPIGRGHRITVRRATRAEQSATEQQPPSNGPPHPVVVAGRVADDYLIDDGSEKPRHLDRDALGVAWAANRKSRFALTSVAALPDAVDLPAAIRAALITSTDHLTGPVLGHYFDANMGLRGMAKFVADLWDSRTKTGWARRFPTDEALHAALRRLAECLTWQYTAVGGTRPLCARFLTEAADVTGLDLFPAAEDARLSGQIWTELADLAGSASSGPVEHPAAVRDGLKIRSGPASGPTRRPARPLRTPGARAADR